MEKESVSFKGFCLNEFDNKDEIKEGDEVRVNMAIVKSHDNIPPYLSLVRKIIKEADGIPIVVGIEGTTRGKNVEIASSKFVAAITSVFVPMEALTKVR